MLEFGSKHRVKRAVREERSITPGFVQPVDTDTIPISVRDEGPFVHYPASPDDIRNVMYLLPRGSLDGLRSVELALGSYEQDEPTETDGASPDPYVGRVSHEILPGIYAGETLAIYLTGRARIRVHAYVYDRGRPDCEAWEPVLRAAMLASFVHEVAHHDDRTRRVARGRWTMAHRRHTERYAQACENAWVDRCVIPYVRETYHHELVALVESVIDRPDAEAMLEPILNDPECQPFVQILARLLKGPHAIP